MDFEELNLLLTTFLEDDPLYLEIVDLLRKHSEGKLWLIGGIVYRTLSHLLYQTEKPSVDYDFLTEKLVDNKPLAPSWRIISNKFGSPKFIRGSLEVDLIPLERVHSIQRRGLEPTVENYLSGVPLTIQSLAYSVYEKELIGKIGLSALLTRTVSVNNRQEALYGVALKGFSLEDYIEKKAKSLEFTSIF